MSKIEIIKGNCLEVMKTFDDNQFDLCLTDPPYGIGISSNPVRQKHAKQEWDNFRPTKEYFSEMIRVSKNQIIWGGNYFSDYLRPSKHFLVWNELQPENFTLAMCEMAWSSFDKPAKMFTQSVHKEGCSLHPTQKPRELFWWCVKQAEEPKSILDPFSGSGTTASVCEGMDIDCVGIEISPEYCEIARKRVQEEKDKMGLFNGV